MNKKLLPILLITLLAVIWGSCFFFIKIAGEELPPGVLVFSRLTIAFLVLYPITLVMGIRIPMGMKDIKNYFILGFTGLAFPIYLISLSQYYIASSLASLAYSAASPITTCFLAHYLIKEEITLDKVFGCFLGLLGILCFYIPRIQDGIEGNAIAILFAATAGASFASQIVFGKRYIKDYENLVLPTGQCLAGMVLALPIVFFSGESLSVLTTCSWKTLIAITWLGAINLSLSFIVYYKTLEKCDASLMAVAIYLTPLVSILLGAYILMESITWEVWLGGFFVLISIMLVNGQFEIFKKEKKKDVRVAQN